MGVPAETIMEVLLEKLGIDWKLFLAQTANFLLLLIVLRIFAYKPLLDIMKKRKRAIEEGLAKAEEADTRLQEVDRIAAHKMRETETASVALMKEGEARAKVLEAKMMDDAKRKQTEALQDAERSGRAKGEELLRETERRAAALVKSAIVKTVTMKPEAVDDALIAKAVAEAVHESHALPR